MIVMALLSMQAMTSCCKCDEQLKKADAPLYQLDTLHILVPQIPQKVSWCGEELELNNPYVRERFDREIMGCCYSHNGTMQILKRAHRYFPIIEKILKEEGMPDDLKYLAAIESNLNPVAYSPAKAAGLWQMIPEAAKEYGLQVDSDVDERYNIEKETRAACKYMRKSYEALGRWDMSAASYNAGQGRLVKKKKEQLAETFYDMNLPEETNRYVFRILAMKTLMENPEAYGFQLREDQLYPTPKVDTVVVDSTIQDLAAWAKEFGLSYRLLKEENFWLRTNTLPNPKRKPYVIRLACEGRKDN